MTLPYSPFSWRRNIVPAIEGALRYKQDVLFDAVRNTSTPFPVVEMAEEEKALCLFSLWLLESGLTPLEAGRKITDLSRRTYSLALQEPAARRGASWFGKEGLHRQLTDTVLRRNSRECPGNQCMGEG